MGYTLSMQMIVRILTEFLKGLEGLVWGPFLVIFLVGTGVYLTFLLKGVQFRSIGEGFRLAFSRKSPSGKGSLTPFQALTMTLGGTVGTGNIAGVATALTLGGVGAIFWLWVSGIVGMAIIYAESVLAVHFREKGPSGALCGGPMYYISRGLRWKWMGKLFALFGVVASLFGIGNLAQAHSIADGLKVAFGVPSLLSGLVVAALLGVILIGGVRSIGRVTSFLVPAMTLLYLIAGLIVLARGYQEIPHLLGVIIHSAFHGQAAIGGFAGASAMAAVRLGISRGVFSNEAGMGSTSIGAATAMTNSPRSQGLISMVGTLIDTLIICTVTGLVIGVTSSMGETDSQGALLTGVSLTAHAFGSSIPGGGDDRRMLSCPLRLLDHTRVVLLWREMLGVSMGMQRNPPLPDYLRCSYHCWFNTPT